MNRDELGPIAERAFDLHLVNHFRDVVHHVSAPEQLASEVHQLGHTTAVANELEHLGANQRNGFRIVQANAACEPLLCKVTRLMQRELVSFVWRQMHTSPFASPRLVAKQRLKKLKVC